jgi:phthiocerol/phenolphthiocerol synthesis type-I polyketide synthase C
VAIESRFGVQIPVMALTEASTLAKLVEKLIEQLRGAESGTPETATNMANAANALANIHGSDMTSEQIAQVAQQLDQEHAHNRIVH